MIYSRQHLRRALFPKVKLFGTHYTARPAPATGKDECCSETDDRLNLFKLVSITPGCFAFTLLHYHETFRSLIRG